MKGKGRKFIFILIQLILYGSFLTLDILERNIALSNKIKFAIVVLCFIYVLSAGKRDRSRDYRDLVYALAFTVVSDILILLSDYYFFGVSTFIIAQQLYGLRIARLRLREGDAKDSNSVYRGLGIRLLYQLSLAALLLIILWLADVRIDALLVVSLIYFISISTNVINIIRLFFKNSDKRDIMYFAIGMILFLLCDINVGLFNLSAFLAVTPLYDLIYNVSSILMWTFYAPSQVFIALSGDKS